MKLRKCTTRIYNPDTKQLELEYCYFHSWTQSPETNTHPEDPQKDHVYSVTLAVLEHIKTGRVFKKSPSEITFID